MTSSAYIIDTSYLLELFEVPGHSKKHATIRVKERFSHAMNNSARLYVPLPCIFELGNHIAGVTDGTYREKAGSLLHETVDNCINESIPWIITPLIDIDLLPRLTKKLSEHYLKQQIGLTDTFIIYEARRLKKKYSSWGYKVHIWTTDEALKALEPDSEKDAFLGL